MMRADLYSDIYVKENTYWWHVGKRLLVQALLDQYFKPGQSNRTQIKVLDVGCGAGRVLQMLADYGQAFGTDLSSLALEFCRRRGFDLVFQADIVEGLPFASNTFDLITALDVVEHLPKDVAGLRNLWTALKPGGLLVVSVPAYQFLFSYWDEILGHQQRYTRPILVERLEQAGFKIEKSSYSNVATLFPAATFRLLKSWWLRFRPQPTNSTAATIMEAETDFVEIPGWLNTLLIKVYQLEAALLKRLSLPFGLAVIVAARKPAAVSSQNQVRYASADSAAEPLLSTINSKVFPSE